MNGTSTLDSAPSSTGANPLVADATSGGRVASRPTQIALFRVTLLDDPHLVLGAQQVFGAKDKFGPVAVIEQA